MLKVISFLFSLSILYGEITCDGEVLPKIIDGFVAEEGNFPYQVSLQINGNLHCGGTILDMYHVLTAAHCLEGVDTRTLSVVVGSANLNKKRGTRYQVTHVKIHEKYNKNDGWANDIALLRIAGGMKFDQYYVHAAVLPERGENWPAGQSAVISGFGALKYQNPLSPVLYKTQVFTVSNDECKRSWPKVKPTQICTGNPTRLTGACHGDSGGPLNIKKKVVGIVSYGHENCAGPAKNVQVFTRISAYIDWINKWRKIW